MTGLSTLLATLAGGFLALAALDQFITARSEGDSGTPPPWGGSLSPGTILLMEVYALVALVAIVSQRLAGRDEASLPVTGGIASPNRSQVRRD